VTSHYNYNGMFLVKTKYLRERNGRRIDGVRVVQLDVVRQHNDIFLGQKCLWLWTKNNVDVL
jgi:hypothetical protein